ncbi:MAG: DUF1328 domain-containing protein [Patiriisocius sp.]|uniref:DUF1328 domain-containing protein n=1 Tax=Patiriisocius sp. TaxID=2822396 RepID=UPI003EFA2519
MKNYTSQFLIVTLITGILGFTGLEFTGASVVRFIFLVSAIGLLISCLDSVLISKNMRKLRFRKLRNRVKNN